MTKTTKEIRNRAKGALWGICIGDCLGDYLQFGPPSEDGKFITEMMDGGPFGTPAGYWTDDFSMALCIMRTFNEHDGWYSLKDVADGFHRWYRDGWCSSQSHAFDVGGATARAIMLYAAHNEMKNGNELTQGNGSIMRHAPAYFIGRVTGRIAEVSHEISDLTHNSEIVRKTVDDLNAIIEDHLNGVRTRHFGKYVDPDAKWFAQRSEVGNRGWCVDTLDSALWAFHKTNSFEDALVAAVNNGHDADSVGAVCGQIAGSFYGYDAIPVRWIKAVKDWLKIDETIERFIDLTVGKVED